MGVELSTNMPSPGFFVATLEKYPEAERLSKGAMFMRVSDDGLAFCDANKSPQVEFKYKTIASWAATKTNFAFVCGDISEQKKYVFKTEQGQEISDMLRQRVNEVYGKLLAAKEASK